MQVYIIISERENKSETKSTGSILKQVKTHKRFKTMLFLVGHNIKHPQILVETPFPSNRQTDNTLTKIMMIYEKCLLFQFMLEVVVVHH